MKVNYGAIITVEGSLNLGSRERKLSISELAQIHDVIQKGIQTKAQESLGKLTIQVSKVVILNLDNVNES